MRYIPGKSNHRKSNPNFFMTQMNLVSTVRPVVDLQEIDLEDFDKMPKILENT